MNIFTCNKQKLVLSHYKPQENPRHLLAKDHLQRCQQEAMETIITRKLWRWIGHVLRKDANSITKAAIHWTPEGKQLVS